MAAKKKTAIEVMLVSADIGGIKLQPRVVKSTRLVSVDLVWPRCTIARKTSARADSLPRRSRRPLRFCGFRFGNP